MSVRSTLKTPLAFLAVLVLAGAALLLWLPQIFPVGRSLEVWLEGRYNFFRELQLTQEALRDVEYSQRSYMLSHDPQALETFHDAAKSVEHHLALIKDMRQNELLYRGEKIRSLSTRASLVIDQLRQSAASQSAANPDLK